MGIVRITAVYSLVFECIHTHTKAFIAQLQKVSGISATCNHFSQTDLSGVLQRQFYSRGCAPLQGVTVTLYLDPLSPTDH